MEHENKKRGREGEAEQGEEERKKRDLKEITKTKKKEFLGGIEDCEIFKLSDSFQPLGVFEFPWEKEENLVSESEWKTHDIFYSALLDGCCSGAEEFPPPELVSTEEPEEESWPLEGEEIDGADCIWSCVLSQPLSVGESKVVSSL